MASSPGRTPSRAIKTLFGLDEGRRDEEAFGEEPWDVYDAPDDDAPYDDERRAAREKSRDRGRGAARGIRPEAGRRYGDERALFAERARLSPDARDERTSRTRGVSKAPRGVSR